MSCNLPRCKGTPERTTCGKNQREERALPRSQNPRLRAKNGGACAALREQSFLSRAIAPERQFFYYCERDRVRHRPTARVIKLYPPRSSAPRSGTERRPWPFRPRLRPGPGWTGTETPRECSSQCSARHYRNNRRRHTLIKRTHHTRDPSSHAT